jgi:8-oxo-dGTP diphosphatase
MNLGSSHVIVEKKGKVLLTQRQDVPIWVIPGGRIEKGESPKDTAVREFAEEVGYKIAVETLIGEYPIQNSQRKKYLYLGKIMGGKKIKSAEVRNLGWFKLESLPNPMTLYEKARINDFKSYLVDGEKIRRPDNFDMRKELLSQMTNPLLLFAVFLNLAKAKLKKNK